MKFPDCRQVALPAKRAYGPVMADLQQLRTDLNAIRAHLAEHGDNARFAALGLCDVIERVGVETVNELTLIRQLLQTISAQGERDA